MVHITEELLRGRAEHNDGELSTLEELSLHQLDVEQIQKLESCCRRLRILYLQNNLIPRIENLGRLKQLEYLNLALNNIEVIENLEGCESLQKLDLTVNFVGRVSGVETLRDLCDLRELFLVGNPCAEFQGYRPFVVATLPQLQWLDGKEISRSEKIAACQQLQRLRGRILQQEQEYDRRRAKEREEARRRLGGASHGSPPQEDEEQQEKEFWETPCAFTPESRLETHRHLQEKRRSKVKNEDKKKPPRTLITADGRVLNVNEPKLDFTLTEDDEDNTLVLDLAVFRHMDTSLMDVDVQPSYVRVAVKGKIFQLVLPAEVKPDSSTAQRSQTTGHLLVTMQRAKGEIGETKTAGSRPRRESSSRRRRSPEDKTRNKNLPEKLEVDPGCHTAVDLTNIVQQSGVGTGVGAGTGTGVGAGAGTQEAPRAVQSNSSSSNSFSEGFLDDPSVPPLI